MRPPRPAASLLSRGIIGGITLPASRIPRHGPGKEQIQKRKHGSYVYIVSLVDAQEQRIQWTTPFIGVISAFTTAETWMLY